MLRQARIIWMVCFALLLRPIAILLHLAFEGHSGRFALSPLLLGDTLALQTILAHLLLGLFAPSLRPIALLLAQARIQYNRGSVGGSYRKDILRLV